MQFKLLSAILVFCGSYFPLSIILALQDISDTTWTSGVCNIFEWNSCRFPSFNHSILSPSIIIVTGLCLLLTFLILKKLRVRYPIDVLEVKPIPNELINYSFPYIVSFMGVEYGSTAKVIGLLIFLGWLFLLSYRAGQILLNPVLLIFGWNLYEAKVQLSNHTRIVKILSKTNILSGSYLSEEIQGNYIVK